MSAVPAPLRPFAPSWPAAAVRIAREPAGSGTDEQTARTVARMVALARGSGGAAAPAVQRATADALRSLPTAAAAADRAAAIFWWVKGHVRFREDPPDDEMLIEPALLLAMPQPQGDCDDFSTLTAAMLTVAGIPWEFVTVAADRSDPHRFSHVYVRALGYLALDTSHGARPGWEAEQDGGVTRKVVWPSPTMVRGSQLHGLTGLGQDTNVDTVWSDFGFPTAPMPAPQPSSGAPSWLAPLEAAGLNIGTQITRSLFPIPTYQQTGPGGTTTIYQGQSGSSSPFGVGPSIVSGNILTYGALAIGLFLLVKAVSK